jgi:NADP-dependent 3-hydroxy acid dehydrogenase YdfG
LLIAAVSLLTHQSELAGRLISVIMGTLLALPIYFITLHLYNRKVAHVAALFAACHPLLVESSGQVIFINSTQGLKAAAGVGQFAATQHAIKAVSDSLRDEVNASGVRVTSIFLGRTATERQRAIFAIEGRPYPPERLIQPADVGGLVLFLLRLPRTSEVTDILLRPMQKT